MPVGLVDKVALRMNVTVLTELGRLGVPTDVLELLTKGEPRLGAPRGPAGAVKPWVLVKALQWTLVQEAIDPTVGPLRAAETKE
jgi:hypothetical protein